MCALWWLQRWPCGSRLFAPVSGRAGARRGAIIVMVAVVLLVLLLASAFVFDVGRVILSAQEAQRAADAAALAGAMQLRDGQAQAAASVGEVVGANSNVSSCVYTQTADSPTFYGAGDTIPSYRALSATEQAVRVAVQTDVQHFFAPVVRLRQTRVTRSAIAARLTAMAINIAPIWISSNTPMTPGESMELHMSTLADSNETLELPAGNFGWLMPQSSPSHFDLLLSGYQVPLDIVQANMVSAGDYLTGLPGQKVGQWSRTLGHSHDDLGRLDRASESPYAEQTPDNFTADNPRLLFIPLVEVISGSGSQATYSVVRFAMFWLESVDGPHKSFTGTLIDGDVPGLPATPDGSETGIWTVKLVG